MTSLKKDVDFEEFLLQSVREYYTTGRFSDATGADAAFFVGRKVRDAIFGGEYSSTCLWRHTGTMNNTPFMWDTDCGGSFILTELSPTKGDYKHCPKCGGDIILPMNISAKTE